MTASIPARILISTYDAGLNSSLTNAEMGALYVTAVQALYPTADVDTRDGSLKSVAAFDADGLEIDDYRVIAGLREAIGVCWEQATIDHPPMDATHPLDTASDVLAAAAAGRSFAEMRAWGWDVLSLMQPFANAQEFGLEWTAFRRERTIKTLRAAAGAFERIDYDETLIKVVTSTWSPTNHDVSLDVVRRVIHRLAWKASVAAGGDGSEYTGAYPGLVRELTLAAVRLFKQTGESEPEVSA